MLHLCGRILLPPLQEPHQQYKYALLESDERQLQHSLVCYGLEASSPFAAVPRLHVLFPYLPYSQQQHLPQEKRKALAGAFMVEALARGSRGLPLLQQVAAAHEIPLAPFQAEEITEVTLAETNLWSEMMRISVAPPSDLDGLLSAPGCIIGPPVYSGVALAAGGTAITPPLLPPLPPLPSDDSPALEKASSVATPQLLWGALSGFLACLIPPCRMRVAVEALDPLEGDTEIPSSCSNPHSNASEAAGSSTPEDQLGAETQMQTAAASAWGMQAGGLQLRA
ncbi:hypothetical protein cyc_09050 [Cyclospora cayetanensis]|uniref:Uncharacterized protein n=1 Tax=Cyclospora cayetanensis TaxID=88456 RepID=A0A1D3D3U6_9EIME|nr:hypothetical protein cyc_09050 [Cyclospora cayetanensis]